eukprot:5426130-Prymnesium_polylepis.1
MRRVWRRRVYGDRRIIWDKSKSRSDSCWVVWSARCRGQCSAITKVEGRSRDVNVVCWRGRGSMHALRAIRVGEALIQLYSCRNMGKGARTAHV